VLAASSTPSAALDSRRRASSPIAAPPEDHRYPLRQHVRRGQGPRPRPAAMLPSPTSTASSRRPRTVSSGRQPSTAWPASGHRRAIRPRRGVRPRPRRPRHGLVELTRSGNSVRGPSPRARMFAMGLRRRGRRFDARAGPRPRSSTATPTSRPAFTISQPRSSTTRSTSSSGGRPVRVMPVRGAGACSGPVTVVADKKPRTRPDSAMPSRLAPTASDL